MNLIKRYLLLSGVALYGYSALAVPAYPGLIKVAQPDGTKVEIRLNGDERVNWASTADGYTLLRNGANFWTFARLDAKGLMVPSELVYRNNSADAAIAGIVKRLEFTAQQKMDLRGKAATCATDAEQAGLQVDGTFPSKGQNKLLLLLLNYSDTEPSFSSDDFSDLMNQEGYSAVGSFRDYYLENSYGQLDITTVVTRWVTLPYSKKYYGADRAVEMIQHGLDAIDDEINLKDFDNDGDGVLDGLAVIHQGAGQEYTGNTNDIWSHSGMMYGISYDGVQLRRYTIEPELQGTTGQMSTIGVVCHEFGHNLGAPDFYDTDYNSSGGDFPGTGQWDLMSNGAWNGEDYSGNRPAGINMWQKIQLGWVDPTVLDSTQRVEAMPAAHNNAVAYRFDTTVPGEYFIMENRQQEGAFDSALPGHGLIVYHASEALIRATVTENALNATYPQAMYTVCASAGIDPTMYSSSYGNVNSDSAPFPGSFNVTTFNDASLPSTRSISGRYSYKALTNIAESADGKISFDFVGEEAPLSPVNISATVDRGVVTLTWDMPEEVANDVVHFNVYREDNRIAQTQQMTFVDDNLANESVVTYQVDAEYSNGLVSPYASVTIRVPANIITEIMPTVADGNVTLEWNLGTSLTRMTDVTASYIINEYNVTSLDFVHRYRADDLKVYAGYTIRKIAFVPYQSQKDVSFTLRVWEADADGKNAKVVSERVVKEFGSMIWNTMLLTKSVKITGDKELWIGLHCESKSGSIQLLSDVGPSVDGYGNWMKIRDSEWSADNVAPGNFFLYAPLSEPEAGAPVALEDCGTMNDVSLDLLYPVGFAVYRDNVLLGWSASRSFVDYQPLAGVHTYSVSSLFKGENESVGKSIDVVVESGGIVDAEVVSPQVVVNGNQLAVQDYNGKLLVTDVAGRVAFNGNYSGAITLPSGLYLVTIDNGTIKVVVK